MMWQENKCHNLETNIQKFHKNFSILHQKGLPSLRWMTENLVPLEEYQRMLHAIATDKSRFAKIQGTIIGKSFTEGLSFDLLIKNEIKHLFVVKPTF